MAEKALTLQPGFNTQLSQVANVSGWSNCSRVRWKNGLLEKLGGWHSLTATPCAGLVRSMHAYTDLSNTQDLVLCGDGGAQVYVGGSIYNLNFVGSQRTLAANAFSQTTTTVTVTDVAHGQTTGNVAHIPIPITFGSTYTLYPQAVTIVSTPTADTWTFTSATAVTGTIVGGTPQFLLDNGSFADSNIVVANWLPLTGSWAIGSKFTVNMAVAFLLSGAGNLPATVNAGTYTITHLNGAGGFWFNSGQPEGASNTGHMFSSSSQIPIYYQIAPPSPAPASWFADNFGNDSIVSYTKSALYKWAPPLPASGDGILQTISGAPTINTGSFVAMPQAQILAFGSEITIGQGNQDPLLLRWSDAGSETTWLAASANQAGSFRLSRGSYIVGGIQAPQATLIWTDIDLWLMTYGGPPLIYNFLIAGSGCGMIAPHACAVLGTTTYWMGTRAFWSFSGGAVNPIECPVWDIIFEDLDRTNQAKCFAGSNSSFHEVWFFYPSTSGGTGEIDSYVKVNVLENLWDFGKLVRTSWLDNNAIGPPLGTDGSFVIQRHEEGYDDNTSAMSGVFAETGYFALSDGGDMIFFDQMLPDFKWFGAYGGVNVTIKTKNYSGDNPKSLGPYSLTPTGQFMSLRSRSRYVALRFDWAPVKGFSARVGLPKLRVAPSGKNP